MRIAYRCRAYPDADQIAVLNRTFGCVRLVWNKTLAERRRCYDTDGKGTSYRETDAALTAWKRTDDLAFLSEVSCVPLQQTLRHQHTAYQNFFGGRARYPRFKTRTGRQSAHFTRSAFRMRDGQLRLAKTAVPLRFVWSVDEVDPAVLNPTMVVVAREPDGRWYVTFVVDTPDPAPLPVTSRVVGVDLGLKDFAVTSDGERIPNPRHLERKARNLARYQRRMARKRRGSCNRAKAKRKVAAAHRKVGNLFEVKLRAIEALHAAGIDICLVVTVVNGVNNDQVGPIIKFALENCDKISFVSFQPVSFTGRDEDISDADRHARRYTLSHLARDVKRQTGVTEPLRDWFPLSASSVVSTAGASLGKAVWMRGSDPTGPCRSCVTPSRSARAAPRASCARSHEISCRVKRSWDTILRSCQKLPRKTTTARYSSGVAPPKADSRSDNTGLWPRRFATGLRLGQRQKPVRAGSRRRWRRWG